MEGTPEHLVPPRGVPLGMRPMVPWAQLELLRYERSPLDAAGHPMIRHVDLVARCRVRDGSALGGEERLTWPDEIAERVRAGFRTGRIPADDMALLSGLYRAQRAWREARDKARGGRVLEGGA